MLRDYVLSVGMAPPTPEDVRRLMRCSGDASDDVVPPRVRVAVGCALAAPRRRRAAPVPLRCAAPLPEWCRPKPSLAIPGQHPPPPRVGVLENYADGTVERPPLLTFWGVWYITLAVAMFRRPLRRRQSINQEVGAVMRGVEAAQEPHVPVAPVLTRNPRTAARRQETATAQQLRATLRESSTAAKRESMRTLRPDRAPAPPTTARPAPRPATTTTTTPRRIGPPPATPGTARARCMALSPARPGTQDSLLATAPRPHTSSHAAGLARAWRRPRTPELGDFLPLDRPPPGTDATQPDGGDTKRSSKELSGELSKGLSEELSEVNEAVLEGRAGKHTPLRSTVGSTQSTPSAAQGSRGASTVVGSSTTTNPFDFDRGRAPDGVVASTPASARTSCPSGPAEPEPPGTPVTPSRHRREACRPQLERLLLPSAEEFTRPPPERADTCPHLPYPAPERPPALPRLRRSRGAGPVTREEYEAFLDGHRRATAEFHADAQRRLGEAARRRAASRELRREMLLHQADRRDCPSGAEAVRRTALTVRLARVHDATLAHKDARQRWWDHFYETVTEVSASPAAAQVLAHLQCAFEGGSKALTPSSYDAVVQQLSDEELMTPEAQFALRHVAPAFRVPYVVFRELLELRHIPFVLWGRYGA